MSSRASRYLRTFSPSFAVFLFLFGAAFLQKLLHDGFLAGLLLEDAAKRGNGLSHFCFGDFLPYCHVTSLRRKFSNVNSAFISSVLQFYKRPHLTLDPSPLPLRERRGNFFVWFVSFAVNLFGNESGSLSQHRSRTARHRLRQFPAPRRRHRLPA